MDALLKLFSPERKAAASTPMQEMVARATDEVRGQHVDWDLNLEIVDIVRGAPEQTADVLEGLRKRLLLDEPEVSLLSLTLLEALMKNTGATMHEKVANKDFLGDVLVRILHRKPLAPLAVRERLLALIEAWAVQFDGSRNATAAYPALLAALTARGVVIRSGSGATLSTGSSALSGAHAPPKAAYPVFASPRAEAARTCDSAMPPVYDEPLAYHSGQPLSTEPDGVAGGSARAMRRGSRGAPADDEDELDDQQLQLAIQASLGTGDGGGGGGGGSVPEARRSHTREQTHPGRGGVEDSSQEIDLPTQMAAIENSVALCRECLTASGSSASKDEVLNDLVRHLRESAPRLAAAIEGESVRDEALLSRLLLLHESVAAVLLAHQRVLDGNVSPDPFPSSTRAPPPAPPPTPPTNLLD